MATAHDEELFGLLRKRGVRKKVAKPIARLEGNRRRAGAKGRAAAQQAVEDLSAAADDIRKRVLHTDVKRSRAARKAAQTRARKSAKRSASSKRGAQTRAKVSRARSRARSTTKRSTAAKR
jgi:hypothetical protein